MTDSTFTTSDGREVTSEQQAKMAEKIGKLIAMSEDESLPREARSSYAEMAEKLMREYRVNEEHVISTNATSSIVPVRYTITIVEGMGKWFAAEFQDEYMRIWKEIRNHAGLVGHFEWEYDAEGNARKLLAVGYGYEIDVRLAQFLWTAAHLTFATRIDAKVDPRLSDQLNCYYMRGSAMERNDIAHQLWGSAYTDGAAHGKVQKLYLAECAARNEEPSVGGKGFQAKRYRKAYAEGFCDQFGYRLRDARSAIDAQQGGIVLHGRKDRVRQAYWAEWPEKAPLSPEQQAAKKAEDAARSEAYWAAVQSEQRVCLEKGNCRAARKRAEERAGRPLEWHELETAKCKKHRPYEATASDRQRWAREERNPERTAGRRAGVAAASSVEFRRTAGERTQKAGAAPERTALGS
jgi:hypothetical protein